MTTRQSYFLVFAFLTFSVLGNATASAQYEWAKKMFSELSHDFGTVVKGEKIEHRFFIENSYLEDMHVESVSSSCGCTEVSIDKRDLKTWEKAELTARFNTLAYAGDRKARITIVFSRPYYAVVTVDIKGTIRTDTVVTPGAVEFGTLVNPTAETRTINVTRYGNPNWKITEVLSAYPHVGVSIKETERNLNRVNYELLVRLKESAPLGNVQNELILVGTDTHSAAPVRMSVPLTANISAPLQISPTVWNISNVKPDEVVKSKVVLKADKPFRITDVTCANKNFLVSADSESKAFHVVTIQYKCEENQDNSAYDLTFLTDMPSSDQVTLKAVVSGK